MLTCGRRRFPKGTLAAVQVDGQSPEITPIITFRHRLLNECLAILAIIWRVFTFIQTPSLGTRMLPMVAPVRDRNIPSVQVFRIGGVLSTFRRSAGPSRATHGWDLAERWSWKVPWPQFWRE